MAEEIELSVHETVDDLKRTETNSSNPKKSGGTPAQKLLRVGILTVGVLCIIQAVLNISLWLAFHSQEQADQFPFNSSLIAEVCQIDQSQQISTQPCSCCIKLLRRLQREYQVLETERDRLRREVIQLTSNSTGDDDDFLEDASGSTELPELLNSRVFLELSVES